MILTNTADNYVSHSLEILTFDRGEELLAQGWSYPCDIPVEGPCSLGSTPRNAPSQGRNTSVGREPISKDHVQRRKRVHAESG